MLVWLYKQHEVLVQLATCKPLLVYYMYMLYHSCYLQVWLKQPLVSLTDIQERHNIVDALVEDPLLRERLRNLHLRGTCALDVCPSLPCLNTCAILAVLLRFPGSKTGLRSCRTRSSESLSHWRCRTRHCLCAFVLCLYVLLLEKYREMGAFSSACTLESPHDGRSEERVHAGLPDVERLARKLERRKASLADLCQLYRASSRLPMLVEAFRDYEGPHAELLSTRCAPPSGSHELLWNLTGML